MQLARSSLHLYANCLIKPLSTNITVWAIKSWILSNICWRIPLKHYTPRCACAMYWNTSLSFLDITWLDPGKHKFLPKPPTILSPNTYVSHTNRPYCDCTIYNWQYDYQSLRWKPGKTTQAYSLCIWKQGKSVHKTCQNE